MPRPQPLWPSVEVKKGARKGGPLVHTLVHLGADIADASRTAPMFSKINFQSSAQLRDAAVQLPLVFALRMQTRLFFTLYGFESLVVIIVAHCSTVLTELYCQRSDLLEVDENAVSFLFEQQSWLIPDHKRFQERLACELSSEPSRRVERECVAVSRRYSTVEATTAGCPWKARAEQLSWRGDLQLLVLMIPTRRTDSRKFWHGLHDTPADDRLSCA